MSDRMVGGEIPAVIQVLLEALGLDANLLRQGPYNWQIKQGSAMIDIAYHEQSGLIIGEAVLCKIPTNNRSPLFKYLLTENDSLEGLTFSVRDDQVILSLLIHDRQFNTQKGKKLFQMLLDKADYYDNILVEKFGAEWIKHDD